MNVNKNQYKQETNHFRIPVPGWGDGIWPELEMMKWQMIENMLLVSMKGNVNSIFNEGDLRISQDSNGSYTVTATATGNAPSLQGTVAGAYFDAPGSFSWTGLQSGKCYYLYVKGSSDTFQNPQSIDPVASTTRISMRYVVLVAKADLTGAKPTLDRNPSGKVNTRHLANHVLMTENPHGDKHTQDELLVRKHLALGDGNDADLELDVNGEVVHVPVSRLVDTLRTTTKFVDFITEGTKGVTLTVEGRVRFASVVRTKTDNYEAGEVIVGFYGVHPDVQAPNQVVVWNSGGPGVSMRAMIVYE
jgi:hypothetical protein